MLLLHKSWSHVKFSVKCMSYIYILCFVIILILGYKYDDCYAYYEYVIAIVPFYLKFIMYESNI